MSKKQEPRLSRRLFLQLTGAVGVAAGCSPKAAHEKLIPYLNPPESIIPGTPAFYRTVCRECPSGCGVTARTREGRVVKLEGNPEDPIGRGALCARGQAALQGLYSPTRFRGPKKRGADGALSALSWDAALAELGNALGEAATRRRGSGVRLLTRAESGSAGALQRAFLASLGCAPEQRLVLEPFDAAALRAAGALFDREELPTFDLAAARSVVSFGADFLETWLSPVELTRGFAQGRGRTGPERTRLTWVGPRRSATGVSADAWLAARPGSEATLAFGILHWLLDPANRVADLAPEAAALRPFVSAFDLATVEERTGVPRAGVVRLCEELSTRRPSALLGPGVASSGDDATGLAFAVQLVNYVLGNLGRTVHYGLDPLGDPPARYAELHALVEDMKAGRVEVLLLHHADPLGALPASLGMEAALAKVPLVVSFSDRPDATTRHAHLILPDHHPLESFGDVSPRRGVVALCQPVMTPLWETRSTSQVLLDVAAKLPVPAAHFPFQDFYEYVLARAESWAAAEPGAGSDLAATHRAAQARGGYYHPADPAPVKLHLDRFHLFTPGGPQASGDELSLALFPTARRYDGRSAELPWLNEVPDPTSTVCWSSWAELAPATAARFGVGDGDVVALTTPAGTAELPVKVYPALRPGTVAVPLGGPEALALIPSTVDPGSGGLAWQPGKVSLRRTGRSVELAQLEGVPEPHAGELLRTVSAKEPALAPAPKPPEMYPPPEHPRHRWAMSIDLDRCVGCQACVVACYAENNVPVVGPELITQGRHMGWLRIERYFEPEPEAPAHFLPMLCQQCDNAPCEPVCPVYATYHTAEGLNAQVYNRCVGTRYCANNCAYKARAFNYQDPTFPAPLDLQLNPDVTVRSKGVMEKCTFCVQRIRLGENTARDEGRPVADGEILPACAQTCPAQAIVFGDAADPKSRISALRSDPRGFRALEELNTRPAVTYLAKVKEEES